MTIQEEENMHQLVLEVSQRGVTVTTERLHRAYRVNVQGRVK